MQSYWKKMLTLFINAMYEVLVINQIVRVNSSVPSLENFLSVYAFRFLVLEIRVEA